MTEPSDEPGDETIDVDPAQLEAARRDALRHVDGDDLTVAEPGRGAGQSAGDPEGVRVWRAVPEAAEAVQEATEADGDAGDGGDDLTSAQPDLDEMSVQASAGAEPDRSSAAAFLAEARERADTESADLDEAKPGRSRSLLVIGLAVVVAAQILAGGVYLALQALGDDEVATDQTPGIVEPTPFPTPTARPTVDPTATALPTATAVPPTPEWSPVDGGPRWAPFTFVVTASGRPAFFDAPDGEPVDVLVDGEPLGGVRASGAPLRLRVLSGDPSSTWAQVDVPDGAQTRAWIRSADFAWSESYRLIQVDVSTNRVRIFEDNNAVFEARAATGARSGPTAEQQTWIVENPSADGIEGPARLVMAPVAGLEELVIEPTSDDSVLGEYVTDGSVLVSEDDARRLARFVIAGAKVEVIGRPTVPTPTPAPTPTAVPTPTPAPAESFEPGDSNNGCPPGAQGLAPNCYRRVPRVVAYGECPGNGIEAEDRCLLLGGDPNADIGEFGCPEGAPLFINERCYADAGPRPEVPGECPPGSTDVEGECREPA